MEFDAERLEGRIDIDVLRTYAAPERLTTPFPVRPEWVVISGFTVRVYFSRVPLSGGSPLGTRFAFALSEQLERRRSWPPGPSLAGVYGDLYLVPHALGMGRPEADVYCWTWSEEDEPEVVRAEVPQPPVQATEEPRRRRISFGE